MAVLLGLCRTCSETLKTGFVADVAQLVSYPILLWLLLYIWNFKPLHLLQFVVHWKPQKQMSSVIQKPAFCILWKTKGADQLCFRYIDSTINLLYKSKISSLYPTSMAVQPVCVRPVQKHWKQVFSWWSSNYLILWGSWLQHTCILFITRLIIKVCCVFKCFLMCFSLKMECEKLAQEKTEMQRHYVMVSSIYPFQIHYQGDWYM